jgi:uncharacterized protein (TIGR00106 family)
MTMVIAEFSLYPLDKGESLGPYVARSLDIIDRSGLEYSCHAMGTLVEGDFDQVMAVVKRCFDAMAADCHRIECSIKLDYRKDRTGGLRSKVASVERRLGRPVRQ